MDAGQVWAPKRDSPGAARRLQRVDHPVAIETPLVANDQRHRIGIEIDSVLATRHPMQVLGPRRDAARRARLPLEQSEIELAALLQIAKNNAQSAAHVEA